MSLFENLAMGEGFIESLFQENKTKNQGDEIKKGYSLFKIRRLDLIYKSIDYSSAFCASSVD